MEGSNGLLDAVFGSDACRYAFCGSPCLWRQAESDRFSEVLDCNFLLGDWVGPCSGRCYHLSPEWLAAGLVKMLFMFERLAYSPKNGTMVVGRP